MVDHTDRFAEAPVHYQDVEPVLVEHVMQLKLQRARCVRDFYFLYIFFVSHRVTEPHLVMYYRLGDCTRFFGGWGGMFRRKPAKKDPPSGM